MRVLVAAALMPEGLNLLTAEHEVDYRPKIGRDDLLARIPNYDAIIVRGTCPVDKEAIERGVNLKVIGTAGVGVNHIDVEFARKRGIKIVNAAGANADSVAELTIALMIELCRHVCRANYDVKEKGIWDKNRYLGKELAGKTLGLIGFGQIGSRVAEIARALKMNVCTYDPYVDKKRAEALQVEILPLEKVLTSSDIVSIHVPLTKETNHLISYSELKQMRRGSYLINMSRGGIVDEEALADALESGHLAGAGFDVLTDEPLPGGTVKPSRLLQHENFIITPHIGAWTIDAQKRAAITVAKRVLEGLEEKPI